VEERDEQLGWRVEIVTRSEEQQERGGLQAQPPRWIVERSCGWLGGFRRLSQAYEYELASSEAMSYAARSHLLLRRLTRQVALTSSPDG